MNYLYVESMAFADKFGITQGAAMDYLDWRIQTEKTQMEAAFGAKRCDPEYDGTTETGSLTQSTDESEDISGGAESDEDQDFRTNESDGLADATTAPSGVGCSSADEQVDEKSAWSDDCIGGVEQVPTSRHR